MTIITKKKRIDLHSVDHAPGGPAGKSQARPPYRNWPLRGFEFAKYFFVSLLALGADTGLLLILARSMHYVVAATIGFIVGAGIHYLLSVSVVFKRRRLQHRKWLESSLFVLFGVLALGVNIAVIAAGVEWLSLPLLYAKILAAGCSFVLGYALRKRALF